MQKHLPIVYPINFEDEFWCIGRNMKHVLKTSLWSEHPFLVHNGMLNFTYFSATIWLNVGMMLEHLDQQKRNLAKIYRVISDQINSSCIIVYELYG